MKVGVRIAIAAVAAAGVAAFGASAATTHTYPVTISITVDRPHKKIHGNVDSPAPAQFCETAHVRIMHPKRGKDDVVAIIRPNEIGEWTFKIRPNRSGDRLYAQTLSYHLPNRPVVCEAGRSRTVTAP